MSTVSTKIRFPDLTSTEFRVSFLSFGPHDQRPMVSIDSNEVAYSRIARMYLAGDGEGIQIGEDVDAQKMLAMCRKIAAAVHEYYSVPLTPPASGSRSEGHDSSPDEPAPLDA